MSENIDVGQLTFFETSVDGAAIKMHLEDAAGRAFSICFPLDCLQSLIMTLPNMITSAVQRLYRDPTLRVTYPVSEFQLELGSDLRTRILTLATVDGFAVSFSLTAEQCQEIGLTETPARDVESCCGSMN